MKTNPVVINITNLVGTLNIPASKENTSAQIQENVNDALLKVLKKATEPTSVVNPIKDYSKAKELLRQLIRVASIAITAIDTNSPHWEICNLADEEIESLTNQISKAVLRECTPIINSDTDIIK